MTAQANRRRFLRNSSAATLAFTTSRIVGVHTFGQPLETRLNLGIIGCGGIMTAHVKRLVSRSIPISFAWLCDVDPQQIDKMASRMGNYQTVAPKRTQRYEDVIGDANVDAVIVATPHHWHAPIALAAIQSGKDVYLEKPISHVYNEGHAIIQAAKKYNRIVQQGSQMRSSPVTEQAGQLLTQGIIGEIKVARAWTAEPRTPVAPLPDGTPPSGVDYDRWLGPAPKHAFNPHRFHQTWRMFREYANGEIGDDGIHDIDMAVWGLGVSTLPKQITARGGRMIGTNVAGDYPDNMNVVYEYPDGKLLIYENYPFTPYGMHGYDNGNVFYGTEGYMIFSRRGAFNVFLGPKSEPGPTERKEIRTQRGYEQHMDEFLECVRTRMKPRANPEVAHRSCALVHLGEIAFRTRGQLNFDPQTEKFLACDEANAMLDKEYRAPYSLPKIT